ncbi:IS91 family transposase [candidate division KSB1 bacterium]|nr:IS91 family transposase [candidate division KSB1 bacterium]
MTLPNTRQTLELGDIFREYGPLYRASHRLSTHQLKAMTAIETCRTKELGGHLQECDQCGAEVPAYDSCGNRHCPKCGWLAQQKWLAARKQEVLSVGYFHVVLTVPDLLNLLFQYNQKVMCDLLFRAGKETLLQLGHDPKHLGGLIGVLAFLHTWGQNLIDHPHLHCIVPCGGLSEDEMEWIYPRKSKKRKKFFVHVNILSDLFKKKFMHYLNAAYERGKLNLVGAVSHLQDTVEFNRLKDKLYKKTWVTYCKAPFGGAEAVLEYLSQYSHRVAISNHRLVRVEDGRVYFKWKNYRKGNKLEETSLEVTEFIRRFLLHVLPTGYFRIRYYGLFASRNREKRLLCQQILGCVPEKSDDSGSVKKTWQDWVLELTGVEPGICPYCKKGRLVSKLEPFIIPP